MRILMVVPKYPFPVVGGLERQAHELAKALVAQGHAVTALSSRFDPRQAGFETVDGVEVHRLPWMEYKLARFMFLPVGLVRVLFKLRRDVDIVHIHNISWIGAFVTLFAKVLKLPVITKLPNIGDHGIPGMQDGAVGFLLVALLKRADSIVAMTPESLVELACIGFPATRVLKVTNGIPLLPVSLPAQRARHSNLQNVVFVGRLSSEKGLPTLLQAWSQVQAQATRPARLRLIGDGPQAAELRGLATTLMLGESVTFCGFCQNVPAELENADIFVLPSLAEGNSNAILEAMRAALPVVATRVGGASMQVGSEGERFLVPVGDGAALADRLLELIEDEKLRVRTGAAMRARIETVFAIDRIATVYEQAYELLLAGQRERIGRINPALFHGIESANTICAE